MNVRYRATRHSVISLVVLLTTILSGCSSDDRAAATANNEGEGIPAAVRDGYGPFRAMASVTIDHPDRDSFSYVIACEGNVSQLQGAADIDADAGCAALANRKVQQRLIDGQSADRACTQIYDGPDTAVITGNVNGTIFEASVDRSDGCGIADWDELLGDLLIEARGE